MFDKQEVGGDIRMLLINMKEPYVSVLTHKYS